MDDTGFLSLLLYGVFIYSDRPSCDSSLVYLTGASVVVAPYYQWRERGTNNLSFTWP